MDPNQIPPPPDGSAVINTGSIPPPPDGSAVVVAPSSPPPAQQAPVPDSLDTNNPNHSWIGNQMREINSFGAGIGSGVLDTMGGAVDLARKVDQHFGINPTITGAEQKASDFIHQKNQQLQQQNSENPGINSLGKGVESLAEFLIPGEGEVSATGKAMSYADRLAEGMKAAKMLENRPILQKIMQAGVKALASGGEQAAIQGGQTLVKSGGDVGEAAKSAAVAGVTGGVLSGAGSIVGNALTKGGEAGSAVQKLEDTAEQSVPKGEVSQNLADRINQNEADLKSNYGESLRDFQDRTQGTTVPYKDSPLHKTVQDLLGKGKAESTPFDEALDKSRPGSEGVNQTLQDLNDLAKEPEAKTDEWVDADGIKHTETVPAPEAKPLNMDMKTLLDQRKLIGERLRGITGSSSDDLADKQVYGKLLDGIDGNIDQLVQKADDPEVADEYQHLRENYKEHVNAFQDPVIKKITDPRGVPDDAAKAFIGMVSKSGSPSSGVVQRSLNTLQKTLDPMGTEGDAPLRQFGDQVFGAMLKDAKPESGNFNASKFIDTWSRIDPETKSRLFGVGNLPEGAQGAKTLLDSLSKDANDVKNVQRLVRVGLIAAPAALGAGFTHGVAQVGLGALGLLSLVNEKAGVQEGRNMLDFIANHPSTWNAIRAGGRLAENPEAQQGAEDVRRVISHEAGQAVTSNKPE